MVVSMAKESGQYVIDRELGRGSYGSVYLLICPASPSQPPVSKYALKVIDEHGARRQDREMACKELRIMRDLYHPSIVALVDSFEVGQRLFLVLELCEHGDLRSFLDNVKEGGQSESRDGVGVEESLVLRWTQQLAAGLEYMHCKKILHRDLKPQNIFLKDKFNIKIGDLGIARQLLFTKEMAATHIGTPLYISPEMYQGNPYSYKSDVWSLGCCVYEMMTLRYAFHAPSRYELVGQVVSKQVRPLPRCYHPSLGALVLSMLDKEPQHRPGAGQVRQALQELASQTPQLASKGNQRETTETSRPERPKGTGSVQVWRLEVAKALQGFLSRRQAAQSAQLLAAFAERLALGSIRDVQDSADRDVASSQGEAWSAETSQSETRHASSTITGSDASRTEKEEEDSDDDDDVGDDDTATSSSSLVDYSPSFINFYDQKVGSLTHSQNAAETTLLAPQESSMSRRRPGSSSSLSPARAGPHRPHSKHQRVWDGGDSHASSDWGTVHSESSTFGTSSAQGSSEQRRVKIGKSSMVVKSRPLPYPPLLREGMDGADRSGADQTVSSLGASSSPSTLTALSSSLEEELGSSQNIAKPGTQPFPSDKDAQRVYANEVLKWARDKLSSPAPLSEAANGSHSNKTCGASGEVEVDRSAAAVGDAGDSVVKDKEDVADRSEDVVQVNGSQDRGKRKKRNFLKERKNKDTKGDGQGTSAAQTSAEEKKKSVTLFTRGQHVRFTNQKEEDLDLTVGGDRTDPSDTLSDRCGSGGRAALLLAEALGETKLQAAVSTAVLLGNSPALLQFQLRELLGRENFKMFAAAIVDLAKQSP